MTHHFSSSIMKITKDGATVLSSYLDKGEKLVDGTTYAQVTKAPTIEVKAEKDDAELRAAEAARVLEETSSLTLNEAGTGTTPGTTDDGAAAAAAAKEAEEAAEADKKKSGK